MRLLNRCRVFECCTGMRERTPTEWYTPPLARTWSGGLRGCIVQREGDLRSHTNIVLLWLCPYERQDPGTHRKKSNVRIEAINRNSTIPAANRQHIPRKEHFSNSLTWAMKILPECPLLGYTLRFHSSSPPITQNQC